MAIRIRRGDQEKFSKNKLLPGELGLVLDTGELHFCYSAGNTKKLQTREDIIELLNASTDAYDALQQLITDLNNNPSELTNILSNISSLELNKLDKSNLASSTSGQVLTSNGNGTAEFKSGDFVTNTKFDNTIGDVSLLPKPSESIVSNITECHQKITNVVINVKDYGAKGDGTTNDTSAIQSAINAIPQSGVIGGKIFFPTGKYVITNLNVTNKVGISFVANSGLGFSVDTTTIIVTGANSVGFDLTDSRDIYFENIRICGDGLGSTSNVPKTLVFASRSTSNTFLAQIMFNRVMIDGGSTLYHVFLHNCDGSTFENCNIIQYWTGGCVFGGDIQSILVSPFLGTYANGISHSQNFFVRTEIVTHNASSNCLIYLKENWGDNTFRDCMYGSDSGGVATNVPVFLIDLTNTKEGCTLIDGGRQEVGGTFIKLINDGGVRYLKNFTVKGTNLNNDSGSGYCMDFGTALLERCTFEQPLRIRGNSTINGSGAYTDCVFDFPNNATLNLTGNLVRCKTNLKTKIKCYKSTSQTINTGTETAITWGAKMFDERNEYDTTNSRFTAQVTGYYMVTVHLRLDGMSNSSAYELIIKLNGYPQSSTTSVVSGTNTAALTSLIRIPKGAILTTHLYHTSSSSIVLTDAGSYVINYLDIQLVE